MKNRILSVLLALCMVICMAPATALASDDDSVMDMKVTELIQGDRINALYPYWVHTNGTKTTFTEKDSIELEDETKISPSEGQWLIQDVDADSGDIQFVPRYVEPEVYMIPDGSDISNIKKVTLKEADSDGMAEVSQDDWNTEELSFFSGMDFKVRKKVDKLRKGSFKLSITGKDGTDYTNYFYFYLSESCSQYWGRWINNDRYMLGGIPDNKVKIYIMPLKDLLRVKAGVAGKGGSVTPTDKYYPASDTDEKEYTVAPDLGYKVDKVEYTDAEGKTGDVRLNQSTGSYVIYPSELGQDTAGTALRTAYIKAYFKSGHTHCICGGETFDGHETHTAELDWVPWTSTTSLPDEAGNYFLQDNVTLPSGKVTLPDGVNLCLNGKSVTGEDASGTKLAVTGGGTLTVTDCGDGNFGNMTVAQDSKLVMYGGKIDADAAMRIDPGVTFTMTGRTQNEGSISVYGDARFTMEGKAKNNAILRLYETGSDSRIVFGGHADSSGTIEIAQSQEGAPVRVEDSARIRLLSSPMSCRITLTVKDDAVVEEVSGVSLSELNLSGNAKLGSKNSGIELQGEYINIRDNAQLIGAITYCCVEDGNVLTLQDQTKIIGSLTMKKIRDDSNIKGTLIMKDNSTIQGGLSCAEDTISFEMQDNAAIDGNIAVADSKVNGKFTCTGEIYSGIFYGEVVADGIIQGGTFFGKVTGRGQINDTAMCSVSFTTNGLGTDTHKVLCGQKVGEPVINKDAIREGYIFGGWYNGGALYDFSTPVLGDIVLMASIIPCDHSGNSSKATCKDKAKCEICGQSYGELDAANHTNLVNVPAKAATKTEEGNIEYWYCDGCSKYFSDKDGTKEIKLADTVVEKLKDELKDDGDSSQTVTEDPWKKSDTDLGITVATVPDKKTTTTTKKTAKKTTKKTTKKAASAKTTRKETAKKTAQTTKSVSGQNNTKSPQTGDDSNPILWMVWMLVSGCALMGLSVRVRRRKEENK